MESFTRTLRPRNWTRKRINRELKAIGCKQADLMRQLGKSRALVSEVVSGKQKSMAVATAIAAALGRLPHEIWPRLYAAPRSEEMNPLTTSLLGNQRRTG